MVSFWETVLLGASSYAGNPMQKHIALHRDHPLSENILTAGETCSLPRWMNFYRPGNKRCQTTGIQHGNINAVQINASDKEGFIQ